MKKLSGILFVSLAVALTATLFFACSGGAGGSDDTPSTFPITIVQSGAGNDEAVTANVTKAVPGQTITLTASLGTGRRVALGAEGLAQTLATISVDGETVTFPMPAAAVIITATFSDIPSTEYAITITPTGATGSEEVTADVTEATEGTTITLTATLGTGRRVALSADGLTITPSTISADGDEATFTMPGNAVEVTAAFSDIPPMVYAISITPNGAGTGETVTANVTEATEGTTITLTASLNVGSSVTLSAGGLVITPSTISANGGAATFTMPASAVEVTATFSSVYPITVTYSTDDGTTTYTTSEILSPNTTAGTLPADPSKTGYSFDGWYTAPNGGGTAFTAMTTVTDDITVYAKWSALPVYTISFDSREGSAVAEQEVVSGGLVTEPAAPTRLYYDFTGWYTEAGCTTLWDFSTDTISADRILYAGWSRNPISLIYEYTITDGKVTITDYNGSNADVVIPEEIQGYPVISIGAFAFSATYNLTSVVIPDSVTSIGDLAFERCRTLTSIVIGDSVTSIGHNAFNRCDMLTSVDLPDSLTSIGDGAFYYCHSLTTITIPDSVTSIGDQTFFYCPSMTSVVIGNSVTTIGNNAFIHCEALTSVTIPDSVTSIGANAFEGCPLTSVTIPASMTSIGESAFYGCGLTNVIIHDSVTNIGDHAFANCGLTNVTIPESVTSIGDAAFAGCRALTSVVIPDSVTSIGYGMFSYCESLTNITIPDSVTTIGDDAFMYCTSMTSVTIGNSVNSIGEYAFLYSNLETIYIKAETPPVLDGEYVFDDNKPGRIFYVPASNDDSIIDAYKEADGWSEYSSAMQEYDY